jgi:hypothetical protein
MCGVYEFPDADSVTIRVWAPTTVHAIARYNGMKYNVWARYSWNCTVDNDFAVAPSCPTPSEMIALQDCNDVACGEYCVASGTLPDGRSDYEIDNCMAGGQNVSVYVHLCGGTKPTSTSEAWHETRHEVFRTPLFNHGQIILKLLICFLLLTSKTEGCYFHDYKDAPV